jgi:murein peptide amidase A
MQNLFRFYLKPSITLKIIPLIFTNRLYCTILMSAIFCVGLLWPVSSWAVGQKQDSSTFAPFSVQEALQEILNQATGDPSLPHNTQKQNNIIKKRNLPKAVTPAKKQPKAVKKVSVAQICKKIGAKLGSVNEKACLNEEFSLSGGRSVNGLPIIIKEYPPVKNRTPQARILVLGGIHGDEFSSVSIVFKWMQKLNKHHSGLFHWRIAPLVNPDGLLRKESQRMNQNNVDLNRNFPTAATHSEWLNQSRKYWVDETERDPRRYPGPSSLSEPESRWVTDEIQRFKPHAVVSIHAPFGLLDFDGPPNIPPEKLGKLYLSLLGTYPGSLGRYVGSVQRVPIITIELEHAGIMPSKQEVRSIWKDLVSWLVGHVRDRKTMQASPIENLIINKPLAAKKEPIGNKTTHKK